jgi:cytochrome d ubiquinol oxidase subunit II
MIIFWVSVLALSILLYVLLDGFDLGVGILFGFTHEENRRRVMMSSVAPVWDGNETWLVVAGVVLWGAFPPVYATLLSAFYLPVALMLAGLILRGVAFEFRNKGEHSRWIWDTGFFAGSLVAAFMQGLMVGALVRGLPLAHGEYVGGPFGWLSPFAILCGAGLCLGYTLLGACWLIGKGDAGLRAAAFGLIRWLSGALAALLIVVFVYSLGIHLSIMSRWLTRPYLFAFPVVGLAAAAGLAHSVRRQQLRAPFYWAAMLFVSAFGTFAVTFWPYMIPFSITVEQAAAPHSTLAFMFWGEGLFVFPLMLFYTVIAYRVFRGPAQSSQGDY